MTEDEGSLPSKPRPRRRLGRSAPEAQLDQAVANLASARTKLLQDQSGVAMQSTQTSSAIAQARAAPNAQATTAAPGLSKPGEGPHVENTGTSVPWAQDALGRTAALQ